MLAVVIRSVGIAIGALILWGMLARNPEYSKNVTWGASLLLAAGAALAAIVGQCFFYTALQSGDISRIVPVAGSFPLVAFIMGTLLLGEAVTIPKLAGVVCVVAGVMLLA
jgi:transporter family protein